ncbi:MAG: NUDIX hydrolase [Acidimicrobiia bacterium]|nr:NUDIX hydrolase [Acidimicrobiia bacterium]
MSPPSRRGAHYERWLADRVQQAVQPPVPAATAVLLRQAAGGLQTLLLRRNPDLPVMGGVWVFPGGRVDPQDRDAADEPYDPYEAARLAAVRETAEEAGLRLERRSLVRFSHWAPPPDFDHQLATWFFLAPAPTQAVQVDGREISEHAWLSPAEAIRRHFAAGSTWFLPPTFVTLHDIQGFTTVDGALAAAKRRQPTFYDTRLATTTDGQEVTLWGGDAGYESGDPDLPGPRHRLCASEGQPWRLERSDAGGLT